MSKRRKHFDVNTPLRHADHPRPVTRREFIRQGFLKGSAFALAGGVFSLFTNPRQAMAAVSPDLTVLANGMTTPCALGASGSMIPFICFDLAGGANFAGSNVLVGQAGGQESLLTTAGYSKLGLPGDVLPVSGSSAGLSTGFTGTMLNPSRTANDFVNDSLGLLFHQDSPMLFGILQKFSNIVPGSVDGVVIPARSDNDTGNNPHNPMYLLAKASANKVVPGVNGDVVRLIGSASSDSGGNSMSPADFMNPEFRPTKVDRPSDVTGMVDVGDLTAVLSDPADVTAVMESIARISHKKIRMGATNPGTGIATKNEIIKDLLQCGYLKSADLANRFAGEAVDPNQDAEIVPPTDLTLPKQVPDKGLAPIFTRDEFNGDSEFRKTASVMKMVIDGRAGAGCITMGGYDYHTGDRNTGENRDLRAGRCIGACLEYARRMGQPLMIYVFSDGSLSSNGSLDESVGGATTLGGRGKGEWTGDNESTACSFFLVYNPLSSAILLPGSAGRQIGYFSGDGSVVTSSSPAANNVNLLVNTVVANYLALHTGMSLADVIPNHGLGNLSNIVMVGEIKV